MPEDDLLAQHQRALDILCDLHPCITSDGSPEELAILVFKQVQADRNLLQERIEVLEDTVRALSQQLSEVAK